MIRQQTRATRTDTLFPYTTRFRSRNSRRASRSEQFASRANRAAGLFDPSAPHNPDRSHRRDAAADTTNNPTLARAVPYITCSTSGSVSTSKSRSEEQTSELQSLMRISYAVFFLKKKIIMIHS